MRSIPTVLAVAVAALPLLTAPPAAACSCPRGQGLPDDVEAIVDATVISETAATLPTGEPARRIGLRIRDHGETRRIEVLTRASGMACGVEVTIGDRGRFGLRRVDGVAMIDLCTQLRLEGHGRPAP